MCKYEVILCGFKTGKAPQCTEWVSKKLLSRCTSKPWPFRACPATECVNDGFRGTKFCKAHRKHWRHEEE
jgi:hypothetical protein